MLSMKVKCDPTSNRDSEQHETKSLGLQLSILLLDPLLGRIFFFLMRTWRSTLPSAGVKSVERRYDRSSAGMSSEVMSIPSSSNSSRSYSGRVSG